MTATPEARVPRKRKTVRRAPILLALVGIVVAAIVFNDRDASTRAVARVPDESAAGPSVPSARALSTSWYCAEGTSSSDGRAGEVVVVQNAGATRLDATITVLQGSNTAPVAKAVPVPAHDQRRIPVSEIVQAAEPAVVVETVGGQAVVTHEVTGNSGVATQPCARNAASDWYFANGTTDKGAEQYLVLFDPFGDDAVVDVTFLTNDGVQEPDALQGVSVPRRSRITIAVNDQVPRQRDVAVHVHARAGRIVAERSLLFDGTAASGEATRKGIALSLGATAPSREWYFPAATTDDGANATVAVANFGPTSTAVEVGVALMGHETVAVRTVDVPARSVVSVDRSTGLASGTQYAVTVAARDAEGRGDPVVAELLQWWPTTSSGGVASTVGTSQLARRWVVARPSARVSAVVSALNPGGAPLTARLRVSDRGQHTAPKAALSRRIAASRIGVFDLADVTADSDVFEVTSTRPVAVGISLSGAEGAATSVAVPDLT
jgi:Family of unknown function (DUF5719)